MIDSIVHGDCIEVMASIPSASVDMVLCDLPYGVTANEKEKRIDLAALWKQYLRVTKSTSAIVLTAQFPFSADLVHSQPKLFRYDLVWDKVLVSGHLNANRMPLRTHEHVLVFYDKQPTYNPQFTEGIPLHSEGFSTKPKGGMNYGRAIRPADVRAGSTQKHPRSILTFQKPHPSVALHRTEKPVALFEWLIRTYTNEGDVVLDNCIGSGTTAVACKNLKRRFIGIDNDPECVETAKRRIEVASS